MGNPYQQFMKQSVSTMTPAELLIALYDKAEQELKKAIYYIENNDMQKASTSIIKVQDIVATLDGSLKMSYEISDNLAQLYDFFTRQLIQANISKDIAILKPLIPLFADLKDAFMQISRKG